MLEVALWFVVFTVWHILGISIGYHRLLAHRSFKCPKFIEYFFVMSGYLAFESSPIWWATLHRAHHRYADTELDPHSPRYGNMRAYTGWIFGREYPAHLNPNEQAKDLVNDPLYRLLDRGNNWHASHLTNSAIGFGSRLIIWWLFGWKIALASILAGLFAQQLPFFLNVVCHKPKLGYKSYDTGDDSVNVWWVGLLWGGEGWHNNHHAYPGCARFGFRWYELDVSWLILKVLQFLKLATNLNERFALEPKLALAERSEPQPLV